MNHILDMIPKPNSQFYLIASRNDGAESFWFQIVCCMEAGARSDGREKMNFKISLEPRKVFEVELTLLSELSKLGDG